MAARLLRRLPAQPLTLLRSPRLFPRRPPRRSLSGAAADGTPSGAALLAVLDRVASGQLRPEDAIEEVQSTSAYVEIDGFAKIDHLRGQRTGLPEVVFGQVGSKPLQPWAAHTPCLVAHTAWLTGGGAGQSKTTPQIVKIMGVLAAEVDVALVTRVGPDVYEALLGADLGGHLTHYEMARMVALCR